jgi:hypothetical protein
MSRNAIFLKLKLKFHCSCHKRTLIFLNLSQINRKRIINPICLGYVFIFSSNILVFEVVSYTQATISCAVFIPVGRPICPTCPPYRKRQIKILATTAIIKNYVKSQRKRLERTGKQTRAFVQSYVKIRLRTLQNTSRYRLRQNSTTHTAKYGEPYAKILLWTLQNTYRHMPNYCFLHSKTHVGICQTTAFHTPKHM